MINIIVRSAYRLEAVFAGAEKRRKARERAQHAIALYGSAATAMLQQKLCDKRRRKSKAILRIAIHNINTGRMGITNANAGR